MEFKKIPAFFHIPRSGGTYVLSRNLYLFLSYALRIGLNRKPNWFLGVRMLKVINADAVPLMTALVYDSELLYKTNKKYYTDHSSDPYISYINIFNFLKELQDLNLELFSIVIEPESAHLLKDNFFDNIFDKFKMKLIYYCTMRHPFDRLQSLYNYLTSNESSHEPTHNRFKSKTFNEFIKSKEPPYEWLIKRIIGNDNKKKISRLDLETAFKVLNKFKFSNTSRADILINSVFKECYNLEIDTINHNLIRINNNSSSKEKIKLENLPVSCQKHFLSMSKYDIELYNKYCKNQ